MFTMTPTTASSALNARALGSSTRQTRTKDLGHVTIRSTAADDDKRVAFGRAESALGARARAMAAATAVACAMLASAPGAHAELNKFEAARGGEFNRGSAQQFGGYDLRSEDVVKKYGKDLRLSNFTAADMRFAKLRGANLRGAYLMKAVAPETDFTGADLSDALMDRMVLVKANLSQANLSRVVLTSSDMEGAIIDGADFSDALLDKKTQQALCKTASGKNEETGVDTRQSLGCSGGRARASSPSRYMTEDDAVKPKAEFDESRFSSYN